MLSARNGSKNRVVLPRQGFLSDALLADLGMLGSLCIARFTVWRTTRRYRKERARRIKRLRIVRFEDRERAGMDSDTAGDAK